MRFTIENLRPGLTRIFDVSHTACYLVEGTERAVLIDTGVGVAGLRQVVNELTSKPLNVLITHGHVDHAMGSGEFADVDVYMSLDDEETYSKHNCFETRKDYVLSSVYPGMDDTDVKAVQDHDYTEPLECSKFKPLHAGDCFNLGGVSVEAIYAKGHTPGMTAVLIPEWRIVLLGDACNEFTFLFESNSSSVTEYRATLLKLKKALDGRFDRVLASHGNGELSANIIEGVVAVCDDILAGNVDNIPFVSPLADGAVIAKAVNFELFCREDRGTGNIVYNPNKIY